MMSNHSTWFLDLYAVLTKYLVPYLPKTTSHHTSWPDLPLINIDFSYIELVSDTFVYLPYYIMLGIFILTVLHLFVFDSDSNLFLTSFLSFSEEEVNALDDLLVCTLLIFVSFFYNLLVFHTVLLPCTFGLVFLTIFAGMFGLLMSVPITMLYKFGFYLIIHIRGGATTLSFGYELILDGINLTAFVLRLLIQLVRIIVIGVMYVMYCELLVTYSYFTLPSSSFASQTTSTYTGLIAWWARLLFEFAHTFIIFGIQVASFVLMIFWVFQFLFTLFFAETLELSFLSRTQK